MFYSFARGLAGARQTYKHSHKPCTTFVTWQLKVKTFQVIAQLIFTRSAICGEYVRVEICGYFWLFDFDVIHIEEDIKINHATYINNMIVTHIYDIVLMQTTNSNKIRLIAIML